MKTSGVFRLLAKTRNDIRVCSIPNGQNQHLSILSNLHEKHQLIQVYVCNTVIAAQIKN